MPYRRYPDAPGTWHHVMNRGIAKRSIFENRQDVRYFLAQIAQAVKREDLTVHAFSLMTTHFHLLIQSPHGRMSRGMRRVQQEYCRWFNRRRHRDGPLFRGRFHSVPIECQSHWLAVVRYIDFNPVEAKMVENPVDYAHGSCRHYRTKAGPPWLQRSVVEGVVMGNNSFSAYSPGSYDAVFGDYDPGGVGGFVKKRLDCQYPQVDPLDKLVGAAREDVLKWMIQRATLADGTKPGIPLVSPATLTAALAAEGCLLETRNEKWDATKQLQIKVLQAGLRRSLCRDSCETIAMRMNCSMSAVQSWLRKHANWMQYDQDYAREASQLAWLSFQKDHPYLSKNPGFRIPVAFREPESAPVSC